MGGGTTKLALVVSDYHNPFTDLVLLELQLKLSSDLKVHYFIIAGDGTDFPSISKFSADPGRYDDIGYEFNCLQLLLQKIRQYNPNAEIIYIQGNHEERLLKFLNTNAKPLRFLKCLSFPELAGLNKYGIHFVDHVYQLNNNIIITHGTRLGKTSAKLELEDFGINGISGHTHLSNKFTKCFWDRQVRWQTLGHCSDLSQMDALYSKKFSFKWDQTFCLIAFDEINVQIIDICVNNNKFYCPLNGKYYE